MSLDARITLVVIVATIGLIAKERFSPAFVMLGSVVALVGAPLTVATIVAALVAIPIAFPLR